MAISVYQNEKTGLAEILDIASSDMESHSRFLNDESINNFIGWVIMLTLTRKLE